MPRNRFFFPTLDCFEHRCLLSAVVADVSTPVDDPSPLLSDDTGNDSMPVADVSDTDTSQNDSTPVDDKYTLPPDFKRDFPPLLPGETRDPLVPVIPPEWADGVGVGGDWAPVGTVTTDDGSSDITGVQYPDGSFYPVDGGLPEAPDGTIVDANGRPVGDPPDLPPPGLPYGGPYPAPGGGSIPAY